MSEAPQTRPAKGERFGGFVPSRRLVLFAFLGVLPAILGFAAPELYVGALLWDVALVALALVDRRWALDAKVEVRRWPKGRLHLGAENRVVVRIKNLKARRARLTLRDDPPVGFVAKGETMEVELKPFKMVERTWLATPPKRGRFSFGDLHLRSAGPLGLCQVERTVSAAMDVRVYPDMRGASRLLLATAARDLANLGLRRLRTPPLPALPAQGRGRLAQGGQPGEHDITQHRGKRISRRLDGKQLLDEERVAV